MFGMFQGVSHDQIIPSNYNILVLLNSLAGSIDYRPKKAIELNTKLIYINELSFFSSNVSISSIHMYLAIPTFVFYFLSAYPIVDFFFALKAKNIHEQMHHRRRYFFCVNISIFVKGKKK